MSNDTETLFHQAVETHRSGDVRGAATLYRQVLAIDGKNLDAQYLLGTALLQLGDFDESIERLKQVIAARGDVADAHNNLGIAYKATGDWEQAARSFEAALKIKPEYDQALFNLGSVMQQRGLFADAAKCFRHALRISPNDNQTRFALANSLQSQEHWAEAETCYRGCREAGFEDSNLDINLAFVLARQEKLADAADVYREILALQPDFAEIHSSQSYVDERRGRLHEALAAAQRAVELKPDYAEGHNNLGIALRSLHRLDDACAAFARALEIQTDFALAEFNLGTTRLLAGDYAKGWPGYERRAEALGEQPRRFPQPRWDGRAIAGKRLFVFADQGFGDTIQFARFLKEAKERSQATIVLECREELVSLFAGIAGVDEVDAEAEPTTPFDEWISLSSLPGLLGCTMDTIPEAGFGIGAGANREGTKWEGEAPAEPGVQASTPRPARQEPRPPKETPPRTATLTLRDELAEILESLSTSRTVGLVWQGNPQQARDIVRSCPLEVFARVCEVDDIEFVSLQSETGQRDSIERLRGNGQPIADVGSRLRDFSETAAVIARLDLIITVDTATAHLAGALGVPVWTLLCHTPDWRWGLIGETCPWYPTMRIFRQPAWGDWKSTIDRVALAIGDL